MSYFKRRAIPALAAWLVFPGLVPATDASPYGGPGGAAIAYDYIGRVSLDFIHRTGIVYGYVTHVDGMPTASLFRGAPGENTALLTFRANITFQFLPNNGDFPDGTSAVSSVLVDPGSIQYYFTPNPNHNWQDPNSFSNGLVVATLARDTEQFSILGSVAVNAASASLTASLPFPLGGKLVSFRDLLRNGVTNVTSGPNTPLPGSTQTAPIFAFAGYGLAIGE
jgi:hypothetical protein